jgi:predicted dehydrogenase
MRAILVLVALGMAFPASAQGEKGDAVRLMTLDPGHFHAALIQKEAYPGVSDTVHVYAPLGPDLAAHLVRVAQFNLRPDNPTRWREEVHAGPDFLERMLREKPGNVVVLSGRNLGKIDRILASVKAGLNVLADKPWVIDAADLPKLQEALDTAEAKGVVAYDVMTERSEITTVLQREVLAAGVAGALLPGTDKEPGLEMESVHHVMKVVAGAPNLRPAWFFDTAQQGEAMADVGTHLVDLVPWILFPEQAIDYGKDVRLVSARRWPTVLRKADFQRVTGLRDFPPLLASQVKDDALGFLGNAEVAYDLRGVRVRLRALWNWEAPEGGGDTHFAVARGTRARVEIRQGAEQKWRTELYVVPAGVGEPREVRAALDKAVASWQARYPGVALAEEGGALRVTIPDRFRTGHEAHFAEVTGRFLGYLKDPKSLPRWEKANMLAKYSLTTRGTELSRRPVN